MGVVVSLFTQPEPKDKIRGLTLFDIQSLRELFKGSAPNDRPGEAVTVSWKLIEKEGETIHFSQTEMDAMAADVGDLVYITDSRQWLGGLKSVHAVYGEPHDEDGVVHLNGIQVDHGQFVSGKTLTAEKEM